MQPTEQLIDELYRERVLRARRMSPEEKSLAGPRLFERACKIMADGIRDEHPEAEEEEIRAMLVQRPALAQRLEQSR